MDSRPRIPQPVRPLTQNERILALLADGRWHTTREILANVPCIVHSRIAEINAKPGYRIEHEGAGGGATNHRYRLAGTPSEGEPTAGTCVPVATRDARTVDVSSPSPGASVAAATDGPTAEHEASESFVQLQLVAAA